MSDNRGFLSKYQQTKFKEDPTNLMKCSFYRRRCADLILKRALQRNSNQTACFVLQDKLKDYAGLIDDRQGINNFATVTKSISSNVHNRSQTWVSGLDTLNSVSDLISVSLDNCSNTSPDGCSSILPDITNVASFYNNLRAVKNETNNPLGGLFENSRKESKKISLYSLYEDNQNSDTVIRKPIQQPKYHNPCNIRYQPEDSSVKSDRVNEDSSSKRQISLPPWYSKARKSKIKSNSEEMEEIDTSNVFTTARQALSSQENQKRFGDSGPVKKSLGGKGRVAANKFVPPIRNNQDDDSAMKITKAVMKNTVNSVTSSSPYNSQPEGEEIDERLRLIDPKMIELVKSEIMDNGLPVSWDDIAGLQFAKHTIQEIVVWPLLRPDIFTGLRCPPKGMLLFGPPGTGKTLIGKCIASQSKSTFFSISASSLTSKWIGDGEKMVRALFAVARVHQPAVVFIDEIDSLLTQRSETEHESSRRIKTEFLVQLDGASTGDEDRLLIVGATNRPQELDEAARRRLVKRLYIPLPDFEARKQLVSNLMKSERNDLTEEQVTQIAELTDGYSGADLKNVCQEACLGPIRSISIEEMASISTDKVRPVSMSDFQIALKRVRSSVSTSDLDVYLEWDKQFGMSAT